MKQKDFLIALVVIILILIAAAFANAQWFHLRPDGRENVDEEPVACTMEAKICPDGSAVGRQGPKCEFAVCPDEK